MASNNILEQFQNCSKLQWNGRLDVENTQGHKWSFYYRLGRFVWAAGGVHPVRCWRRQLTQFCPEVNVDSIRLREADLAMNCWDYRLLAILHQQQQLKRQQIAAVVESSIAEHLFDVIQQARFSSLSYNLTHEDILDAPLTLASADLSFKQVQQAWTIWWGAGLGKWSPNLAPVLRQPEQLQQVLSPSVYQNFVSLINGKATLRDLAVRMKHDLTQLTRSLLPYTRKGLVELVQVPDLPLPVSPVKTASAATQPKQETGLLVACVDDSPQTCKMLEQILTSQGLRFMSIQDSIQALPLLIEHKPDLIFLDLVMPIANGYEICAQLRRVSAFANTPVIILTGKDGLVDRVRAKVVKASDFLTKPVEADKVLAVVRKYLQTPAPSRGTANFQFSVISQ